MENPDKNICAKLFVSFLKIGALTLGGGWAMIAVIEREVVKRRGWMDGTEFLDALAVAQSLPGVMAVNVAVALGQRLRGMRGATAAAAGAVLPSFLAILAIAALIGTALLRDSGPLASAFRGIRPAVVALIAAPVIGAARAAGIGWHTIWIPIAVALAVWSRLPVVSNPMLWIAGAAIIGVINERRQRRRAQREGADEL